MGEESEDSILLSSRSRKVAEKGKGVKRSQSPSTSGDDDGERKRPKLDKDAARAIFGGTRIKALPATLPTTASNDDDGNRPEKPDSRDLTGKIVNLVRRNLFLPGRWDPSELF